VLDIDAGTLSYGPDKGKPITNTIMIWVRIVKYNFDCPNLIMNLSNLILLGNYKSYCYECYWVIFSLSEIGEKWRSF